MCWSTCRVTSVSHPPRAGAWGSLSRVAGEGVFFEPENAPSSILPRYAGEDAAARSAWNSYSVTSPWRWRASIVERPRCRLFLAFADDNLGGNSVKPTAGAPSCP